MTPWYTRFLTVLLTVVLCLTLAPASMALSAYDRPGQKLIALTFDDGPGPYTEQILDILKAHNAKATFFLIGQKVPSRPETVKRMVAEGHQVGNHTYDHPRLSKATNAQIEEEISKGAAILSQYTGLGTRFYLRPPYASYNSHVVKVAAVPVIWGTLDTEDWDIKSSNALVQLVTSHAQDGAVFIMHDTVKSTADGLDQLLTRLEAMGYTMVTVEDLFWRRGITPRSGELYYSAPAGTAGVNRCEESLWYDESKLSSHWAWPSIQWAIQNGYMSYDENGEFTPQFPLTRGMFVTILGRLSGVQTGNTVSGFRDIPADHYAAPYAAWARENGIMIGVGSNLFGVDSPLTRQEMAVSLTRYIQSQMAVSSAGFANTLRYADNDAIASWAKGGVAFCSSLGFLKGTETDRFDPEAPTTRAMGATILQRLAVFLFSQ